MDWAPSEEQSWRGTERNYATDREDSRNTGHMTDIQSGKTEKGPSLQTHTLREFEQHLNDLKKENFSLKLRIYFLEERIRQKHEDSRDDVYKRNIELKVEVESLKQELQEKQQILEKSLTASDSLTNHNETERQQQSKERKQETDHMQEVLETKIQLLEEEARLAREEAERMACLAESQSQHCVTLEKRIKETAAKMEPCGPLQQKALVDKDRVIEELTQSLQSKEALITTLTGEKAHLHERVRELQDQAQDLSASLRQKERDSADELAREKIRIQQEMQNLIEEQQTQLNQYECAAGQCVNELQKGRVQVQSLQAKIQESEANNRKLQEKLYEMECELRSIRQAGQDQERTIRGLTDQVSSKNSEVEELLQVIEGQKDMLCKLKETVSRYQLGTLQGSTPEPPALQGELLALQASLFSTQLELQSSQRAHRQALRQADQLAHARDRLHADLQQALRHREAAEKHNQEMHSALKQCRADLQEREGQLKEKDRQKQVEVEAQDKTIQQLRRTLQEKQQRLQEYSELLELQRDPRQTRDAMLDKLKSRIKDRDRALERAIDEKFRCLEEKDGDVRRLQLALREKEMDQEKLRCVLSSNEETILHLDRLVQGKDLQLEQTCAVGRNAQLLKRESEERLGRSLRERDAVISQLQASLQTSSKEAQDLRAALLSKASAGSVGVLEELRLQLQQKEQLFQKLLSERSAQTQQHQAEVQELLHTIGTRDQCVQDCASRLGQVISQRTGELLELRRQMVLKEREVRELSREKEQQGWDPHLEITRLRSQLQEKEAFIQGLMQDSAQCQEEPMITGRPPAEAAGGERQEGLGPQRDLQAVQEELQLVLRREREAQLEVSRLRSTLARHKEEEQTQASEVEALSRSVLIKEQLIKDLQTQLVEPSGLPLVERLTQELQELRETVAKQDPSSTSSQSVLEQLVLDYSRLNEALKTEKQLYHSLTQIHSSRDSSEKNRSLQAELGKVQALRGQLEDVLRRVRDSALAPQRADLGELSAEEEDEDNDDSSEYSDSIEEEENAKLTAQTLASSQNVELSSENGAGGLEGSMLSQHSVKHERALAKVHQLLEQKKIVERELGELKFQLEKAGYTSLSQMRTALLSLRMQTDKLEEPNDRLTRRRRENGEAVWLGEGNQQSCFTDKEMGENHWSVTEAGNEVDLAQGKHSAPCMQPRERPGKRGCLDLGTLLLQHEEKSSTQEADPVEGEGGFWQRMEAGLQETTQQLHSDLALSQQQSRHLQERLLLSEATVQAQAEQLKDYRELLSESSVQQVSKQVQVDLQDLGYETCGRSENEAEREGASSPEFDDYEMCTALSKQDCGAEWWSGNSGKSEDVESLRQHVDDLRAQLSRSRATIRSLQSRVRSLSTTSDYASSLERPRKVNWGFQASPAHSGPEEDEGWQSDGLGAPRTRRDQELRELVSRVASLENQLKNSRPGGEKEEDPKCATWPGKFDSLIQAQARELSHLRQRMREGRGVCHILTQHLGDTTKAFEELLRANDIDYYMGQSFREQLAQSTTLAERISAKISGRDQSELPDDKMGHELLALRLSKELQQKDKIIESLRSKLKQECPDTPSSTHALSETSDQSERTSFVSDEQGSIHEDLDLCSDVDVASEYAQDGRPSPRQQAQTDCHCHGGTTPKHSSLPSSTAASHGAQSTISCPSMPCTQHKPMDSPGQKGLCSRPVSSSFPPPQTLYCPDLSAQRPPSLLDPHSALLRPGCHGTGAFSLADAHQELQMLQRQLGESERFAVPHPHAKPLPNFPLAAHLNPGGYTPLSRHAFSQHHFTTPAASSTLKTDASLLDGGSQWDMAHISQPVRTSAYGDVSLGSSGYQSGTSHTGTDLIEEHLKEIRSLRQRLEDSIQTNDRLRQQLEDRLGATVREGGAPTNIYIQGLDSVSQLSNENRALKEENLGLHARLQQNNRDKCQEAEQLREVVLAARAQLKQAELEAGRWREESRRLQAHGREQAQEIQQLRQDRHSTQERSNRLQHQVNVLQQQLSESRQILHSLQSELQVYERVCGETRDPHAVGCRGGENRSSLDLRGLLSEVRSLRVQLEHSIKENASLREQLEKQLARGVAQGETRPSSAQHDSSCRKQLFPDPVPSPPVRDTGLLTLGSTYSVSSKVTEQDDPEATANDILKPNQGLEGGAPDGSFANRKGRHTIGHVDDFRALQQQILEGKVLVHKMETVLQTTLSATLLEFGLSKGLDYSNMDTLLSNAKTLGQILDEAASLLKMFWRAALPSSDISAQQAKKEQVMKEENKRLRLRITEQEELLQETVERLQSTNHTKRSMEHFIISQLSRTRDVLKKARANLEVKSQDAPVNRPLTGVL